MTSSQHSRRSFVAAACGALVFGLAACGSSSGSSSGSPSPEASGEPSGSSAGSASTSASELIPHVKGKFKQKSYKDSETGDSLPYNIYLPEDYDPSKKYPVVLYIADSSLVGPDVTAPLSQHGELIWASDSEQQKHESIVVVPDIRVSSSMTTAASPRPPTWR